MIWVLIVLLAGLVGFGPLNSDGYMRASVPIAMLDLAPLQNIQQIAAGDSHTCALTTTGGVKCWGYNHDGQLGNDSTIFSSTPFDIVSLSNGVSAISSGGYHTCALTITGGVKCWGSNSSGQLGNDSTESSFTPVDVIGLSSGVTAISAGQEHTCALTIAGTVKCWGYNYFGQLGNNSTSPSGIPVVVSGLNSRVSAISAGGGHTCALVTSGGVKCWGWNIYGQLGDNSFTTSSIPVDVNGLDSSISAISVGKVYTCALTTVGGVKCWGHNGYGQLGNDNTVDSKVPVEVKGLSMGGRAISTGGSHTCVLTTTGGVKCWGYNHDGQLGNGTIANSSLPVEVNGLNTMISIISAGSAHTCALTAIGSVKCWGGNGVGQLGIGRTADSNTPVSVIGLASGVSAISAGGSHTCALTMSGGVKCWGSNNDGQLGNNNTVNSTIPVEVTGLNSGISAISAGGSHTCALTTIGGVKCWGGNDYGQLGNNSTVASAVAVDVNGLNSGVSAISAGRSHTCALTVSGRVKCWGWNLYGQLGDNSFTTSSIPVDVNGLDSSVSAIDAGDYHTCILTSTGGVKCWGWNNAGRLGNNSTSDSKVPVEVSGLSSGVNVISVGDHTCALTIAGSVKCWGWNADGQLGDSSYTSRKAPVDVSGLDSGVSAISVSSIHTCALTTLGGIKCWGRNVYEQPGSSFATNSNVPIAVSDLSNGVIAISAGDLHNCVLMAIGSINCWGTNSHGQLGDGNGWHTTPMDVIDPNTPAPTPTNTNTPIPTPCLSASVDAEVGCATITPTPTATQTPLVTATLSGTTTATPPPITTPSQMEDKYEVDDQCALSKTITSDGVSQNHTFHTAGDEDWVQFGVNSGRQYRIEVQIPAGSQADVILEVYPACMGEASHNFAATFTPGVRLDVGATANGSFWLRLRHEDATVGNANFTYHLAVRTLEQEDKRGALILVAGRFKLVDPLQRNIHKVTQDLFKLFQDHGYRADDIQYLATDRSLPGVDDLPTRANLQSAITTWAVSSVSADRSLTLYLMDHGDPEKFYLDQPNGEILTPSDINRWLSQLESSVPGVKINLIIEACYSGTFLQGGGLSRRGRVIITSTNAGSVAHASASGAYFSDYLVVALRQGYHLFSSYWEAQAAVRRAYLLQEPWLDGNGNGIPNEVEDAVEASQRGFAQGTLRSDIWPPHIFSATGPTQIQERRGLLQAVVKDDKRVRRVWATIIEPSYIAPTSGSELAPALHPTIVLHPQGDNLYMGEYPAFDQIGRYRIMIHAEDDDNLEARPLLIEVENGSQVFLPHVHR